MAKPIGETPTLYGEDALRILRKMNEPPTEKEKKLNLNELYYSKNLRI